MELEKVNIVNFRSIKNVSIDFDHKCRILVGINETGKTNILKALSLLRKEVPVSKEDIREPLPEETESGAAYVRFIFRLNEEEKKEVLVNLETDFRGDLELPIVRKKTTNEKLTLRDFVTENDTVLYSVDLKKQAKSIQNWDISKIYEILPNWKKLDTKNPIPDDDENSESLKDEEDAIIDRNEYKEIKDEYFKDASTQNLISICNREKRVIFNNSTPETIFWKYDAAHILPQQINIQEFIKNPDICLPLKNMFHLAEVTDINSKVSEALNSQSTRLKNLLNRVAKKNTNHFRTVWKEY